MKPGYKMTEVGVIPKDWGLKTCLAVSEYITVGIVIRPKQYYVPHGIPALRSANIREDGIHEGEMVFISEASNTILSKSKVREGDVLTVRTGYPGTSAIVPRQYAGANCIDLLITRPSGKVSSAYLVRWINSTHGKDQVLRGQGGLAQQHFNVADLRELLVAIPSLTEQRAIASALGDADGLIESLERLIAKKHVIKQGAMRELLTARRRLPGFKGEWEDRRIGDFTDCIAGGTPSTLMSGYWNGTIRWMSSGELNLKIVDEVVGRITDDGLRNSSAKMLPVDCVMVGLAGQGKTRGTVAMNRVVLCTNQSIAAILPNDQYVSKYLYYNLDSRYEELRELSSGSGGRGGLNLSIIKSLVVPFPKSQEQTAIASVLSDMDAEIAALEGKLAKARAIKQGMMQELLTGRIRLV